MCSGHARTGSELSGTGSEESSQTEVDRLLRRIAELNEVLEVRETKLVEMSKANLELQEKNTDLTRYVSSGFAILDIRDLHEVLAAKSKRQ